MGTEDHVYKKGYDCLISLVECFNKNYIHNGATKIVNWYDIAGIYPLEPYSEDPPTILAYEPWSGPYQVREHCGDMRIMDSSRKWGGST